MYPRPPGKAWLSLPALTMISYGLLFQLVLMKIPRLRGSARTASEPDVPLLFDNVAINHSEKKKLKYVLPSLRFYPLRNPSLSTEDRFCNKKRT